MPEVPGMRRIDPDAEAARLAGQRKAALTDRQKLDLLRRAVRTVLTDGESQHPGGWGPDVTMVGVLREALEAAGD